MPSASVRRRLVALESVLVMPEFPPFTAAEIAALDERVRAGEEFTSTELKRVEQHSPLVSGELLITCYRGNLFIKRYIGVDVAAI